MRAQGFRVVASGTALPMLTGLSDGADPENLL
jgi:hypothetical protein